MAHNQQCTVDCPDGTDKFPYDEVFKMGGFVRNESEKQVSVMIAAPKMPALQQAIAKALNPPKAEAKAEKPAEKPAQPAAKPK